MITPADSPFLSNIDELLKSSDGKALPTWLKSRRQASLKRFQQVGLPTTKDEDWKYTNISPITQQKYKIAQKAELTEKKDFETYVKSDAIRVCFVNGVFSKELSLLKNLPKGLTILPLEDAVKSHQKDIESLLDKYKADQEESFVALNNALLDDGCFVKVDKDVIIEKDIHICHVTSTSNGSALMLPRLIMLMGKSSQASILQSYVAFNDAITYFANGVSDIALEENATLFYCKALKESLKSYHIDTTRVWQEANSNLQAFSFMSGGAITRNNLNVVLNGEGSNGTINGLYSIFDDMLTDNHTFVDHRVPNCTSNQLYKGVLNGASRAVFNGRILVRKIAQKTNSYQLNKNLLLGDKCQINTKPQLEIFADDVKCTHGATIGQLNEDELFYLLTRCISKREATRMLTKGFIDNLVNTLTSEYVKSKLRLLLEPSLKRL